MLRYTKWDLTRAIFASSLCETRHDRRTTQLSPFAMAKAGSFSTIERCLSSMPKMSASISLCLVWISRAFVPSPARPIALQIDNLTLACRYRSWPRIVCVGRKGVHEIVVMRRIMVEKTKMFYFSLVLETNAACPRRMAPANSGFNFVLGKRRIVDHQVRAPSKPCQLGIAFSGKSLGVADQRECSSSIFKAIAISAIRVIERSGLQHHVAAWA